MGGQYTLEIYVIHLVLFKLAMLVGGYAGYGLFAFRLLD
jgi:hypothetical protein